jgi:hypothetical protein
VVHLADEREAPVGEVAGDRDLPQRPVAPEWGGEHGVDQRAEVLAIGSHEVRARVEGGIVDPHRVVHRQRHVREALPVARRAAQPPGDVLEQLVESGPRPVLRRVEHRDPADVHRCRGPLHCEERRVERGEALCAHVAVPSPISGRQ